MNINRTHKIYNNQPVNNNFVKDGYIYLFRGDSNNLSSFSSKYYKKKIKLSNIDRPLDVIAQLHTEEFDTPFISLSSSPITAAMYSNMNTIYIVKVPLDDVYVYRNEISRLEQEYLVADYIDKKEVIAKYRFDEIKEIYNYLKNTIKLDISPKDFGIPIDNINDFKTIDLYRVVMHFMGKYPSDKELHFMIMENNLKKRLIRELNKSHSKYNRTRNLFKKTMPININLVRDGYIYLFKEFENEDLDGIKSYNYRNGKKVCDNKNSLEKQLEEQTLFGMGGFVRLTSSILDASIDSECDNVYLVRIPIKDIVVYGNTSLTENEYFVPDFIDNAEIVKILDSSSIKSIYDYLVSTIGLDISPRDIDIETDNINLFDENKFQNLKKCSDKILSNII